MELNVKLIQETFELVKPRAEEFADLFYVNLFADYPVAKGLFGNNMERQKRLLVASLVQVVQNLENPEFLGEYLGKMGERHAEYGTIEAHFEWVGMSLIKTLQGMFGELWTKEYTTQWAMAFDVITALMSEGLNKRLQAKQSELELKVLPLRKQETDRTTMNMAITLPSELTEHLDQLAKQLVMKTVQDYFDNAVSNEFKKISQTNLQDLMRKAS